MKIEKRDRESDFHPIKIELTIETESELTDLKQSFAKTGTAFSHTQCFNKLYNYFSKLR